MISENDDKNLKSEPKPLIFCEICKVSTKYNIIGKFVLLHLKQFHQITDKEYYDRFMKKEGEGICKSCQKETRFIKISFGYRTYCCTRCTQLDKDVRDKIKETNIQKTGYEHNSLDPANWEKVRKTSLEKYGVDSYFKTQEHKDVVSGPMDDEKRIAKIDKTKQTNLERYGVENVFQIEEVKIKIDLTKKNKNKHE